MYLSVQQPITIHNGWLYSAILSTSLEESLILHEFLVPISYEMSFFPISDELVLA
jgi:hypothetical protein